MVQRYSVNPYEGIAEKDNNGNLVEYAEAIAEIRKAIIIGMGMSKDYFDGDDTRTLDQVADDYIKRIESAGGK